MRGEYYTEREQQRRTWELPPRARRIHHHRPQRRPLNGTTSACAENTAETLHMLWGLGNYLRVRGEYLKAALEPVVEAELPPRARRIPAEAEADAPSPGTTSACAENTMQCMQLKRQAGNYLRVRGEYAALDRFRTTGVELPPRARRILRKENHAHHSAGTTSACAENTIPGIPGRLCRRNYLRVRGEYCRQPGLFLILGELPPRARRIRGHPGGVRKTFGTTSACAENTRHDPRRTHQAGNYLRVRGEYRPRPSFSRSGGELPPRARRIRKPPIGVGFPSGTTSACAENTGDDVLLKITQRNYLRVRGEYAI